SSITLDHLLRMSSGLEFDETVGADVTDLSEMLFLRRDAAAFAIDKPLIHPPDTHWQYSSGTTNIISRIAREASGGSTADVVTFLRNELFIPLGLQKAIIEPDSSGNLIGSSYMYATARDWAKFGQLYLQDGIWEGKRLLPEGWVKYSSTPTLAAPKGQYGAHFWTNGGINSTSENRPFPSLPGDLYYADGYKGQRVVIIPSHQLVIVRLGWSDAATPQQMKTMVAEILNAKLH
ncbi:MAG: serine hydrolase, partial [Methylococcales bacterium]|nr:serine hydrolase [Methylococcales bacterium]